MVRRAWRFSVPLSVFGPIHRIHASLASNIITSEHLFLQSVLQDFFFPEVMFVTVLCHEWAINRSLREESRGNVEREWSVPGFDFGVSNTNRPFRASISARCASTMGDKLALPDPFAEILIMGLLRKAQEKIQVRMTSLSEVFAKLLVVRDRSLLFRNRATSLNAFCHWNWPVSTCTF